LDEVWSVYLVGLPNKAHRVILGMWPSVWTLVNCSRNTI